MSGAESGLRLCLVCGGAGAVVDLDDDAPDLSPCHACQGAGVIAPDDCCMCPDCDGSRGDRGRSRCPGPSTRLDAAEAARHGRMAIWMLSDANPDADIDVAAGLAAIAARHGRRALAFRAALISGYPSGMTRARRHVNEFGGGWVHEDACVHWRCSAGCGCRVAADEDGCCAECGAACVECACVRLALDLGGGAWLTLPASMAPLRPEAVSALREAARALVASLTGDGPRLRGVRPPAKDDHLGATEASAGGIDEARVAEHRRRIGARLPALLARRAARERRPLPFSVPRSPDSETS